MLVFLDVLGKAGLGAEKVIAYRHTPRDADPGLLAEMTTLALHRHELISTYQSLQSGRIKSALLNNNYIASFAKSSGTAALFLGMYNITGQTATVYGDFAERAAQKELVTRLGVDYDLALDAPVTVIENERVDVLKEYIGCIEVDFPKRSPAQYPKANRFPLLAIHQEPIGQVLQRWDEVDLAWSDLGRLSQAMEIRLSEWRGIYLITDMTDGARYVGKADGAENILARWRNYAATGHGGNTLLRNRDPSNFRFTILELLAPTAPKELTDALETSWKRRLHSRNSVLGLNAN